MIARKIKIENKNKTKQREAEQAAFLPNVHTGQPKPTTLPTPQPLFSNLKKKHLQEALYSYIVIIAGLSSSCMRLRCSLCHLWKKLNHIWRKPFAVAVNPCQSNTTYHAISCTVTSRFVAYNGFRTAELTDNAGKSAFPISRTRETRRRLAPTFPKFPHLISISAYINATYWKF